MKKFTFIIFFLSIIFNGIAQIPIGNWRTHFSYNNLKSVCNAGDKIFAANEIDLFSYDKNDGSIEKINKIRGLSDAGISKINFNKNTESLFIAYTNSNIDIIRNDTIFNFSEIKRKQINGSKIINNITFKGDSAYLACGFGIVIFDTKKLEFADTYYIGENSDMINVNKVTYNSTKIFAATSNGLFEADVNSSSLSDYRNWTKVLDIPNPDYIFNETGSLGEIIYASQKQDNLINTIVYKLEDNVWTTFDIELNNIKSISQTNNYITFCNDGKIKVYDINKNIAASLGWYSLPDTSTYIKANYAISDEKDIWIADKRFGLVSKIYHGKLENIKPDGPDNNICTKLRYADSQIIAANGSSIGNNWYEPAYSIFKDEDWQTYHLRNTNAHDFYSIEINPDNPNDIYIGSWGEGIYNFTNNILSNHYDETNSTLQTIFDYVCISSMLFDKNKNFWVANWYVGIPISVMTPSGNWYNCNYNGILNNKLTGDMILTRDNYKWLILQNHSGIFAFDDNNTPETEADDRYKNFYPISSDGETISQDVYSLAEDKDENIWVGTGNGVVIYYNPEYIFEQGILPAERIQLTSYGKDTTEQYLLTTDVVKKICVDGANRKWLATQNSGLFLVSENGKDEIHNFNTENSPLISNNIYDIAIDENTGEVFIANEGGVLSYRSDATEAGEDFDNVYVFPNPVRPSYNGIITVTGLVENTNVKFTDISGNLVYETKALGGQAVWDGKTFDGRKVNTGVYLIFITNTDGSKTFVSKLLFIN